MLDLSLLLLFLTKEIETYKVYGNFRDMHSLVGDLMSHRKESDGNSDLVLIYNENHTFVDYFWRNVLTPSTKWFIIKAKNKNDANIIYREIRSMGDCYISPDDSLVILKNIKEDFREHYRENILLPVTEINLLDYLGFVGENEDTSNCEMIVGGSRNNIVASLMSCMPCQYVGKPIADKYIRLCMFLSKTRIKFIEIFENGESVAMFVAGGFVKEAWLYKLGGTDELKQVLRFHEKYLQISVEN